MGLLFDILKVAGVVVGGALIGGAVGYAIGYLTEEVLKEKAKEAHPEAKAMKIEGIGQTLKGARNVNYGLMDKKGKTIGHDSISCKSVSANLYVGQILELD